MHSNDVILSLDLSLACSGWSVLVLEDGKPKIIDKGHIKTKGTKEDRHKRLNIIYDELLAITNKYQPDIVVREKGFTQFRTATQVIFRVVGVSEIALLRGGYMQLPIEIAPTSVKRFVTGDGKADKALVEVGVRELLGNPQGLEFANDDESDAVAVGLSYLIKNKVIAGIKLK